MSKKIKGITVEIGGNTVGLNKALGDANAKIRDVQSELKQVERLLKLDPTNTELLQQKQKLLKEAVAETANKLNALKDAEKDVQQQFKDGKVTKEQYDALKREIISTEQALDKLENQASKSNITLQKMGKISGDIADKTQKLSMVAAGGLVAIGAGMVKSGKDADDLNTLSKQTGFDTAELQKIKYASDIIDVELDTITKAAAKMTKNMVSTSTEVKLAWETLGISMTDVSGNTRSVTDIFYDTIKALSLVGNETERDQLAMQIFGKSANELAGIVDDGGDALKKLGQEAENAGLILTQEALDNANEFNDVLDEAKARMSASGSKIFSTLAKDAVPAFEKIADTAAKAIDKFSEMPKPMRDGAVAALALTAAISPTARAIENISVVAPAATKAIKALKTAMTTTGGAVGIGLTAGALTVGNLVSHEVKYYNDFLSGIDEKYKKISEDAIKLHNENISNFEKQKEKAEEAYNSEISAINKRYDEQIEKIASTQKQLKIAVENEQKLYEKAHKERLNQLEKEKNAKLDNISLEQEKAASEIQAQINALDALTDAENKEKQAKENAEKLEELKRKVSLAKTYAEKVDAEREYTAEVKRQEEEQTRLAREEQKQQLQDKINQINTEADKKREKVNEEYTVAEQLENDKYTLAQEGFTKRLEALDGYIEDETEKLNSLKEANIRKMQEETDAYIKELQNRIDAEKKIIKEKENKIDSDKNKEKEKYSGIKGYLNFFIKDYNVGHNAAGTNDWRGGLTYVHEQGGELINLPQHTQIIPHDLSVEYMRALAAQQTGTANNNHNSTRPIINIFEVDGQKVTEVINPTVSIGLSNSQETRGRALGVKK